MILCKNVLGLRRYICAFGLPFIFP